MSGIILAVTIAVVLPPLFKWQSESQQKALSLSNMRRVASGCLIYSQDWDERMPPPVARMPDGFAVTWARQVRPYVTLDEAFSNPTNPVKPFAEHPLLRDPADQHPIDTSYALNRRFWDQFAPGPFPFGNLEIPEQTALIAEAGRMAADPRHPILARGGTAGRAVDLYGDTTDRIGGLSPYPSMHGGQFGLVAADGHGIMVHVLFYGRSDGPHDTLLGRIGDNIYNWNGGHPNGATDRPAQE
ncbi:MAG TPA: hypothetical protein VKT77_20165 [Chthonomonadaceae bacterium]|nr:hypothetical protein [Chthonomonadaceae bacterium]